MGDGDPATTPVRRRRPPRVTLLVVIGLVVGLGLTALGTALVLLRDDAELATSLDTSATGVVATGLAFAAVGLVYLVLATGLARGNGFVRSVYAVLAVIHIGSAVYALVALRDAREAGLGGAVSGTVVLWLLYGSDAVEEYFAS